MLHTGWPSCPANPLPPAQSELAVIVAAPLSGPRLLLSLLQLGQSELAVIVAGQLSDQGFLAGSLRLVPVGPVGGTADHIDRQYPVGLAPVAKPVAAPFGQTAPVGLLRLAVLELVPTGGPAAAQTPAAPA